MSHSAQCAAYQGQLEAVRLLLDHRADPDPDPLLYDTPLLAASASCAAPVVSLLLDCRVRVMVRDQVGQTPLHRAASSGSAEVATRLLDHGAAVGARDLQNETPLLCAAANGHVQVASLLLVRGAAAGERNHKGQNARDRASEAACEELVAMIDEREGGGHIPSPKMLDFSLRRQDELN